MKYLGYLSIALGSFQALDENVNGRRLIMIVMKHDFLSSIAITLEGSAHYAGQLLTSNIWL